MDRVVLLAYWLKAAELTENLYGVRVLIFVLHCCFKVVQTTSKRSNTPTESLPHTKFLLFV